MLFMISIYLYLSSFPSSELGKSLYTYYSIHEFLRLKVAQIVKVFISLAEGWMLESELVYKCMHTGVIRLL